jgi:hypothetical protein
MSACSLQQEAQDTKEDSDSCSPVTFPLLPDWHSYITIETHKQVTRRQWFPVAQNLPPSEVLPQIGVAVPWLDVMDLSLAIHPACELLACFLTNETRSALSEASLASWGSSRQHGFL